MRILLAEDQAMVRGALAALLSLETDYQIDQACDGDQAVAQLQQQQYDLLLTDIEMPGLTGIELAQWCQQHAPATKVVVLTTFGRAGYIKRAIDLGVGGFLLKDAPSDSLIQAINQVMQGKRVIDPELAISAMGEQDPLNDKERKALRLASDGKTTAEIAQTLFIAEGTVRNYLSEAIAKLHATNRIDAARIAKQKGWL
ncbi:DNA-binding response regulator [Shewanella waksmanii]|uniref:response regulator transcription factor n=1 Tax=Shewanella waksmanii TaxID=213783 RepID=UPI003736EC4F